MALGITVPHRQFHAVVTAIQQMRDRRFTISVTGRGIIAACSFSITPSVTMTGNDRSLSVKSAVQAMPQARCPSILLSVTTW